MRGDIFSRSSTRRSNAKSAKLKSVSPVSNFQTLQYRQTSRERRARHTPLPIGVAEMTPAPDNAPSSKRHPHGFWFVVSLLVVLDCVFDYFYPRGIVLDLLVVIPLLLWFIAGPTSQNRTPSGGPRA